jgi:Ni/Fe-hydrogenase subunit HybB-like protein
MLATGLIVVYGYFCEVFFGWYSGNQYELYMTFNNRMFGPYAWSYWSLIFCNGIAPQILWYQPARRNIIVLFIVSLIVSVGMWLERFVIIVTSLSFEFMPSMWKIYYPRPVDWMIFIGTLGLFFLLFTLFARFVPVIAISEMAEMVHHQKHTGQYGDPHDHGHGHDGAEAGGPGHVGRVIEDAAVGVSPQIATAGAE